MPRKHMLLGLLTCLLGPLACSDEDTAPVGTGGSLATGGTPVNSGGQTTGGRAATGTTLGGQGTGGSPSQGGQASGGQPAGGTEATGGQASGDQPAGGSEASGGQSTGGQATGGSEASGGQSTGGQATGGTEASGGESAGGQATGGTEASGGQSTGGQTPQLSDCSLADPQGVLAASLESPAAVSFTSLRPANVPDTGASCSIGPPIGDFTLEYEATIVEGASSSENDGRAILGAVVAGTNVACAAGEGFGVSLYYAPHWFGGAIPRLVLFSIVGGTITSTSDPPSSPLTLAVGQRYYLVLQRTGGFAELHAYQDAQHLIEQAGSPLVIATTTAVLDRLVLVAQQTGAYDPPCATTGLAFGGNGGWVSGSVENYAIHPR